MTLLAHFCPRCGDALAEGRIERALRELRAPIVVAAIHALRRGQALTIHELADAVYGSRPDDAPDWAVTSLRVCIWKANNGTLRGYGLRIASSRTGPGATWQLEVTE